MRYLAITLALFAILLPLNGKAQSESLDSIDILHHDLVLDLGHTDHAMLIGQSTVTFVQNRHCSRFEFDLICDQLTSVTLDGVSVSDNPYDELFDFDQSRIYIPASGGQAGDTHVLQVSYANYDTYFRRHHLTDGGLFIDTTATHYYIHGEDRRTELSQSVGRSWHPCRDNWYDKATYTITITSRPGWHSQCSGIFLGEDTNADGSFTSRWNLPQRASSYSVSIWAGNAPTTLSRTIQGEYGTYPLTLNIHEFCDDETYFPSAQSIFSYYDCLDTVLPLYERLFGPYPWNRVGFVGIQKYDGMEHIDNIQLGSHHLFYKPTIIHEFAHQWFGNWITAAHDDDMWINEGGATFCEEPAYELIYGKKYADNFYLNILEEYLRYARTYPCTLTHQPHADVFGGGTYFQGYLVWHGLRGYVGDSLFYSAMRQLFRSHGYHSISTASLRDSLSLYTGMDLNAFFDLHLFSPGFVDYQLQSLTLDYNSATVTLHQQLINADVYPTHNRVPITFFSLDGRQADRLMTFDDSVATATFQLPFTPAYAVVDYHRALSDAVTDSYTKLSAKGTTTFDKSHIKVSLLDNCADTNAFVHIAHHFTRPIGDLPEGIVRISNRYWQITGHIPWEPQVNGHFYYTLVANAFDEASHLDYGFYNNATSLDSLALVYRADPSEPWQLVSRKRTSSSSFTSGYFKSRLFPGQYALAIVDTNILALPNVEQSTSQPRLTLYPNPNSGQQIRVDVGSYDKKFNLFIYDIQGRKVLQKSDVSNGNLITHTLAPGTYFVLIQNNSVSLHSQIIIQ